MPGCDICPYRDDPSIRGAALVTGHARFCQLLDPGHPDHDPRAEVPYREMTRTLAGLPPAPSPPPLLTRARNLAGAFASAVKSGGKRASPEEQARRLTICGGCDRFVAAEVRCLECGCHLNLKTRLAAWHCPLDPPKW